MRGPRPEVHPDRGPAGSCEDTAGVSHRFLPVSDPGLLRELAALLERRQRRWSTEGWEISPEGMERLADIVMTGSRPTVGFFVRYGRRVTS